MTIDEFAEKLKNVDLDEYQKVIELCKTRSSGTEGIPAIIGLDDLTEESNTNTVYTGAEMDEKSSEQMALDAAVFTYLYNLDMRAHAGDDSYDMNYPSVANAMSAVAEKDFFWNEEKGICPYRSLFKKDNEK